MAATTWITNLTHFMPDPPNADMPREAARLRDYFGLIVSAATADLSAAERHTAIRCRRRPGHKRCSGHIVVCVVDLSDKFQDAVVWKCSRCEGNGVITSWQNSLWDISKFAVSVSTDPGDKWMEVSVSQEEFDALSESTAFDPDAEQIVWRALWTAAGILLRAPESDMDHLLGCIAADANHESDRKRRRRLQAVFDRISDSLNP